MVSRSKFSIAIILVVVGLSFGPRVYRHFTRTAPVPIPPRAEVTLTIIPGWNLRQVAEYLVLKGFASSTNDVYALTGEPLFVPIRTKVDRQMNFEGYLAPETIRVFKDATLADVIEKFKAERAKQILSLDFAGKDTYEIITMASLIEKETRHAEDRGMVADILWRRVKLNWALQLDSTVHYVSDRMGDVFTTAKERQLDSSWNTYKYPGLPPGPICNPSTESIEAALNPTPNKYWYFLTGRDGKMYYAKTLEEHNANKRHL